ncbi:MAG: CDGSH iron-sulfur domain-containing protein [Bacteroidales bacterium]|nr:CDGSH iron-sulfur domain-containing protein [Bacteroidales bacterium]
MDKTIVMEGKKEIKPEASIEIENFGPIRVTGNFILKDIKKGTEETHTEIYLCKCGRSENKPFCDDSHKK